jgi:organic radical activating enzyme
MNSHCGHKCKLCCNKLYDIEKLPVVTKEQMRSCTTLCLTGGDPFYIKRQKLEDFVLLVRDLYPNIQNVYVYTSGTALFQAVSIGKFSNLNIFDAVNIAPKNKEDWVLTEYIIRRIIYPKSKNHKNRLYVFKEQMEEYNKRMEMIGNSSPFAKRLFEENFEVLFRTWDKEFKTPDNEYFVRVRDLYEEDLRYFV